MATSQQNGKRAWLILGGVTGLFALCVGLMALTLYVDRQAADYPGAVQISSHSAYRLPENFRWDDSYSTQDSFREVYVWYSRAFGLGAESKAAGQCSLGESTQRIFLVARYSAVMICENDDERLIYVNRTTYLR